jgi:hypothetical protein
VGRKHPVNFGVEELDGSVEVTPVVGGDEGAGFLTFWRHITVEYLLTSQRTIATLSCSPGRGVSHRRRRDGTA